MQHLDYLPIGVLILNPRGEVIFWNNTLEQWTHLQRDVMLGQPLDHFFPHLKKNLYRSRLQQVFEQGVSVIFSPQLHQAFIPATLPDGRTLIQHTSVTALENPHSSQYDALISIQDVTELTEQIQAYRVSRNALMEEVNQRKKAEQALEESEQTIRKIFEQAAIGLVVMDEKGQVLQANATFCDLLSHPPEQVLNMNLMEALRLSHHDENYQLVDHFLENLLAEGSFEQEYPLVNGFSRWLHIRLSVNLDTEGEPIQRIGMVANVTQSRQLQQERMKVQLEKERTHIIANFVMDTTHELRSPLSIINSSSYLLERSEKPEARSKRRLIIQEQVENISNLLDSLLLLTRLDSANEVAFVPLSLVSLFHNLETKFQAALQANRLTFQVEIPPDLPAILGDIEELTTAFEQLLANAIHFNRPNGEIRVYAHLEGERLYVAFKDTGIGISTETQAHMFERFYRGEDARTTRAFGLGLAIVKKIADRHQADIQVKSQVGQGSEFKLGFKYMFFEPTPPDA